MISPPLLSPFHPPRLTLAAGHAAPTGRNVNLGGGGGGKPSPEVNLGRAESRHGAGPRMDQAAVARNRRSRRLLVTTNTDENAIAAPAIIGVSRPDAASGIAATL